MLDGVQHGGVAVLKKPSELQVGGDHYQSMVIQPSEFVYKNGLNWLEGNAIKYICRHARKGGTADLEKAKHYIDLLIEWQYNEGENESDDQSNPGISDHGRSVNYLGQVVWEYDPECSCEHCFYFRHNRTGSFRDGSSQSPVGKAES